MPYRLSEDKLCVEQAPQGHWITQKCYKNTDDARAYLGALQANVEDAKAMETTQEQTADKGWIQTKYAQGEVGYTDYAVRRNPVNSVCQTCRWFIQRDYQLDGASNCHIVESYPLAIVGTGYCNQWTARKIVEPEPMEVIVVTEDDSDSEELEVGMMARGGIVPKASLIQLSERTPETITPLDRYGVDVAPAVVDPPDMRKFMARITNEPPPETSFKVLSSGHWLACYTNNFKDDDDEILKAKAHKDAVARAKSGLVDLPSLWRGHIEGTAHGKAQYVDYIETDGVITVFAIGTFEDTPAGKSARRYYEKAKPGEISLSHGFVFPKWAKKNGEYEVYNTFEISTLKRGQEANAFTNFSVEIKDKTMPLQESQIEDIKKVFGEAAPEIIKRVEAKGKADKSLADLGAKYKGFTDFANVNGAEETDSAASKGREASTIEAFKALIPDLLEDNAAQLALLEAMDKRLDAAEKAKHEALEAKVASLENEVKVMRGLLNMPGQAASESDKTTVYDPTKLTAEMKALLPDEVKQMLDAIEAKQTGAAEYDPFFGDLKVKKR